MVLSGFLQKRLSFCLSKVVLFEDEDDLGSSSETTLKHYDLECEGISNIESILKQKILNEKMKAFHAIKTFKMKFSAKDHKRQRVTDPGPLQRGKEQLYRMGNVAKIRNSLHGDHSLINIRPTILTDLSDRQCPENVENRKQNEEISCYEESISGIMTKLHEINRVGSPRSYHDNVSAHMSRYMSTADIYSGTRDNKRMFIMEKLNNLERDVSDLASRGETYQAKSR